MIPSNVERQTDTGIRMHTKHDIIYYEDFPVDERIESEESYKLGREAIIEFAQNWDPRPFHLSEEEAAETPMGALCASGIQTLAIALKLINMTRYYNLSVVAGLSIDNYRLRKPVYVDDELKVRIHLKHKRDSASNPTRGIMDIFVEVLNQHREIVATFDNVILANKRPKDK